MQRVDGKSGEDHGFITCQGIGLVDGARPTPYQNAAGCHRTAKPDGIYTDSGSVRGVGGSWSCWKVGFRPKAQNSEVFRS